MSLVGLSLNVLLIALLGFALMLGLRLNKRLKGLRDSHESFATAVRELNAAAERAEQGLADLRAATDEAVDILGDRIEKGRALATKLERLIEAAPRLDALRRDERRIEDRRMEERRFEERRAEPARPEPLRAEPPPRVRDPAELFGDPEHERRLGALLAAAREARVQAERPPLRNPPPRSMPPLRDPASVATRPQRVNPEDDLFVDPPPSRLRQGVRR